MKTFGLEDRLKKVHLQKTDVLDLVSHFEILREAQGIDAHVGAKNRAASRESEKIAQLARAAARFEHARAVRNFGVQLPCKNAALRFLAKTCGRIDIIIIGKRIFFVERFDGLRYVGSLRQIARM